MPGIAGILIIQGMTGIAINRSTLKTSPCMTLAAIRYVMSARQWKKGMAESLPGPGIGIHLVAGETIGAEVTLHVVWILSCLVICHVAVGAFHAHRFKAESGSRWMAGCTFGHIMGPPKREAAPPVDISNVGDDP